VAGAELANVGTRTTANFAAVVVPHRVLRRSGRLGDQRLLGHIPPIAPERHGRTTHVALEALDQSAGIRRVGGAEGHPHQRQQATPLGIILRGGHEGDLHTAQLIDLVVIDLGEGDLLA
jgi:hypothetical protein